MKDWMFLTLVYGVISGTYFIIQKKAMKKNHSIEVLSTYITISFLLVIWDSPNVLNVNIDCLWLIFVKALVLFISWRLSFKAMSKLSVSKYGVINMSRILFTTLLGIVVLNETLSKSGIIGMIIICLGLLLVNTFKDDQKKSESKYIFVLLLGCAFTAIGGLLDKIIATNVMPNELQWWFLLFLLIINWLYVFISKSKVEMKKSFRNIWIYIYSILFVVGDRILFMANRIPESEISIISLLKQISIVITVVIGGKVFKEKNIENKFICSLVVLLGIIIITLY